MDTTHPINFRAIRCRSRHPFAQDHQNIGGDQVLITAQAWTKIGIRCAIDLLANRLTYLVACSVSSIRARCFSVTDVRRTVPP